MSTQIEKKGWVGRNANWEFGIVDPSLVTIVDLPKVQTPANTLAPLNTTKPAAPSSLPTHATPSSPLSPTTPTSSTSVDTPMSPESTASSVSPPVLAQKKRPSFNPQPAAASVSVTAHAPASASEEASGAGGGIPKATAKLPQKLSKDQKRNAAEARKTWGLTGSEQVLCVGHVVRVPGWQLGTGERPVRADQYLKLRDGMRVEVVGSIESNGREIWVGRSPDFKYGLVERACVRVDAADAESTGDQGAGDRAQTNSKAPPARPLAPPSGLSTPITPSSTYATTSTTAANYQSDYEYPTWNNY